MLHIMKNVLVDNLPVRLLGSWWQYTLLMFQNVSFTSSDGLTWGETCIPNAMWRKYSGEINTLYVLYINHSDVFIHRLVALVLQMQQKHYHNRE